MGIDEDEDLSDLFDDSTPSNPPKATPTEEQPKVEAVSWSKAKTGVVAMALVFILIIILLTIKSAHISKRTEKSTVSKSTETTQAAEESYVGETVQEEPSTEAEIPTESVSTESYSAEEIKVATSEEATSESIQTPEASAVNEPTLSDVYQATGIVKSKGVYKINNCYLYELQIIMVVEENNITCSYYCPKNTWDKVNTGVALTVDYQVDTEGCISVNTIAMN